MSLEMTEGYASSLLIRLGFSALLFLLLSACNQHSAAKVPPSTAIASAHPLATEAGFEILSQGGNAFDAAVAVSATLAVVEPYSSGLGGGGFWLLHRAVDQHQIMIDGREKAPLKAQRNMYLDSDGKVIPGLSVDGALAAGIPGEPAALAHIAKKYGRLGFSRSLQPAIRVAREGFQVTPSYRRMVGFRRKALRDSPAAANIFLVNGDIPALGHVIQQPDLAKTLAVMAAKGKAGFYQGQVAQQLLSGIQSGGGIWTQEDFNNYEIVERLPIRGRYRGYQITAAAPPSSGGVALLAILNVLEGYQLTNLSAVMRKHFIIEAMRRAYRDRAEYLGDADYVDVPILRLTRKSYAATLRDSIRSDKATASSELKAVTAAPAGNHTTHFSILDSEGNRVAATLSINYPFGSGFMSPGTGVLLNDEMDDFSARPGAPNVYGLIGAEANSIAPGKRMLSSMSPTFVENDDRVAILGTPGGSRIISMVLHGILGITEDKTAQQIVSQPRYHHQYLPDVVQHEASAITKEEGEELQRMGHQLKQLDNPYGNMQVVIWDRQKKVVTAASDPRGEGQALVR